MPSKTAIVYRVAYRRPGWKPGVFKHKLFNSEASAMYYAKSIRQPVTDKTPEQYRKLRPVEELFIDFGPVRWSPLDVIEALSTELPKTPWTAHHTRQWYIDAWAKGNGGALPTEGELLRYIEILDGIEDEDEGA